MTFSCARPRLVSWPTGNTFAMHEFFVLPTVCLVSWHSSADALGIFKLMVHVRRLTSLCLNRQIEFHVRWIARECNCSDDTSRRHHKKTFLTACSLHVQMILGEMGPKVRCLHAPRRLVPSNLQAPRRSEDMNGIERNESDATTSQDEAGAHVCRKRRRLIASRTVAVARHSEKKLSFLELHAAKNSGRHHLALQEFLQHTLRVGNTSSRIPATRALEHGHQPVVDGYVPLQTSCEGTSTFLYMESAPASKCFFTQRTDH